MLGLLNAREAPATQEQGHHREHRDLARELPSGSWLYGLSVPQDDRQLLRAMMHGHRDRLEWARACQMLEPLLTENRPRTRGYWLSIPVDAGRLA